MTNDELNRRLAKLLASGDTNVEKLIAQYEGRLSAAYKAVLVEIKKALANMYEKYGDQVTYADMMKYSRLQNIREEIIKQVKQLANNNISTTSSGLKEFFSESYYRTAYGMEATIGAKLGFGMLNPEVIAAAILNPVDRVKWESYTAAIQTSAQKFTQQIIKELTRGLILGSGYAKMASALNDLTGISFNRMIRIIRTEGHRVQSAARIVAYSKSEAAAERLGISVTRVWVSTLDSRTRPTPQQRKYMEARGYVADHRWMDGREADTGTKLFTLKSGATTEGPGLTGIAEEDINCRCTTRLQFNNVPPKVRRDNETGAVIQYVNYMDWYKKRIAV